LVEKKRGKGFCAHQMRGGWERGKRDHASSASIVWKKREERKGRGESDFLLKFTRERGERILTLTTSGPREGGESGPWLGCGKGKG